MGVGERQGLPLSCRLLTGVTLAETSPDDVDSRHSGLARLFGDGSLAVRSSLLGLVDGWTASALALFDGVQPSRPDEPGTRLPPVGPSGDRGARHIECGLPRHSPTAGNRSAGRAGSCLPRYTFVRARGSPGLTRRMQCHLREPVVRPVLRRITGRGTTAPRPAVIRCVRVSRIICSYSRDE